MKHNIIYNPNTFKTKNTRIQP